MIQTEITEYVHNHIENTSLTYDNFHKNFSGRGLNEDQLNKLLESALYSCAHLKQTNPAVFKHHKLVEEHLNQNANRKQKRDSLIDTFNVGEEFASLDCIAKRKPISTNENFGNERKKLVVERSENFSREDVERKVKKGIDMLSGSELKSVWNELRCEGLNKVVSGLYKRLPTSDERAVLQNLSKNLGSIKNDLLELWDKIFTHIKIKINKKDTHVMKQNLIEKYKERNAQSSQIDKENQHTSTSNIPKIMQSQKSHLLFSTDRVSLSPNFPSPFQLLTDHVDSRINLKALVKNLSNSYKPHVSNCSTIKKYQKEHLGRFYKPLPAGKNPSEILLEFLFVPAVYTPLRSEDGRTVNEILEQNSKSTFVLIGRPGSAKTSSFFQLGKDSFAIYMIGHSGAGSGNRAMISDLNFARMVREVQNYLLSFPLWSTCEEAVKQDTDLKLFIEKRIRLEFLARILFLLQLLQHNPKLTPEKFLHAQLLVGEEHVLQIVDILKSQQLKHSIDTLLPNALTKVRELKPEKRIIVAIDEAQVISGIITLISPRAIALSIPREELFETDRVKKQYKRGLLTAITSGLSDVCSALFIMGTEFSLSHADYVESAVSKNSTFHRIVDLPTWRESEIQIVLSSLLNLDDCEINVGDLRLLAGRPRFTASVINQLMELGDNPTKAKETVIAEAIERAVNKASEFIQKSVAEMLREDIRGDITILFCRMVLASELFLGKLTFARIAQADFVNRSICAMRKTPGLEYEWVIDEPLVVEVLKTCLQEADVDTVFLVSMELINTVLSDTSTSATSKGNAFEPIARWGMRTYNGTLVCELPIINSRDPFEEVPVWTTNLAVQIDVCLTAEQMGFKRGCEGNLEYLLVRPKNSMLIPLPQTRPDAIWFFSDAHTGTLAIKLYSSISKSVHDANKVSCDIRNAFTSKDGETPNKKAKKYRNEYVNSETFAMHGGGLRYHFEFPEIPEGEKHLVIDRQNVSVFVDRTNMREFFKPTGPNKEKNEAIVSMLDYIFTMHTKPPPSNRYKCCNCESGCKTNHCGCRKEKRKCVVGLCKACEKNCTNRGEAGKAEEIDESEDEEEKEEGGEEEIDL